MNQNPYQPPNPFGGDEDKPPSHFLDSAQRSMETQDSTTCWLLLITGLIGCFSPFILIFGIIFLSSRPHAFPNKVLAIAGTILHGIWTVVLVAWFALTSG